MLGFEAECVSAVVDFALLAVNSVEEVSGVKLEAGLRGLDLEQAAGMRFVGLCG